MAAVDCTDFELVDGLSITACTVTPRTGEAHIVYQLDGTQKLISLFGKTISMAEDVLYDRLRGTQLTIVIACRGDEPSLSGALAFTRLILEAVFAATNPTPDEGEPKATRIKHHKDVYRNGDPRRRVGY